MKKNRYSINLIGWFFCFILFSFFSFHSSAYPAPSTYYDTVQKIYIGYYQRAADPAGLIYWAGRLDSSGGNLNEIIEAFANSAESQALYGTINSGNISNVVNNIYLALFNRTVESGGLNYYVNGYNSHQFTAATIMLNVLYGAQNADLQSVNNKLTAANLFTRTIDPEFDGANFQVTYAGDGDSIAGRNFLTLVTSNPVTVPTQAGTTAYLQTNIANPGDKIITVCNAVDISGSWSGVGRDATIYITQTCNTFSFYIIDDPLERKGTGHINGSTFDLSWDEPYYNNTNIVNGTISGNTMTGSGVSTGDGSTWPFQGQRQTAAYSNATLSGNWIASGTSPIYMSSDGNGTVTDTSTINMASPPGIYQVGSDGSITISLKDRNNNVFTGTGSLTSSTSGTITFGASSSTLTKVTDLALCQGSYSGTISKSGATYTISFDVSSSGVISNFTSNIPGVTSASGKAFAVGSNAVMMIRTNITSAYSQIHAWGTLGNGQFTGSFENDSGTTAGTISLTKSQAGMVLIPAGSFQMGDAIDGDISAMPVHTVTLSAFYLDKYEVTKALWDEVYNWATAHGYTWGTYGDPPRAGTGTAATHPVQTVEWYSVIKWLNARSEKEGRTPVYYTDVAQTIIYKAGDVNVTNSMVKWMANGYRLPTEAEWEYAARAGTTTRFYTGDCISTDQANYDGRRDFGVNLGPGFGCPIGQYRGGTMPVGSFPANPWGLHDMAGNVSEWTWDYRDVYSSDAVTNPRGPASGKTMHAVPLRTVRGGSYSFVSLLLRSADRTNLYGEYSLPMAQFDDLGFRSARSQP